MKKKKANSSVARENAELSERSDLKYHNKRQWLVKYKDLSGRKFNFQLCFKADVLLALFLLSTTVLLCPP